MQPLPVLPRVVATARIRTPAKTTRRADGASRMPSSAKKTPTVSATLQAMSSEYTHGFAASSTRTDPPRIVAMSTPYVVASARPIATGPLTSSRTLHINSAVNRPVTTQDKRIDAPVRRPSRLWVNKRTGIRSKDGNTPK